eukprot:snap_masked-scaffold_2-processed-gene-19.17-mRNA-1 protein AED:1.00 eAED:1.00 QI:0/0/0/0/1/1/2/0/423
MPLTNETSCDSPFFYRLSPSVQVLGVIYICFGMIMAFIASILYAQRQDTVLYLLNTLNFILDEPSRWTSCSATVFLRMSFLLVPCPAQGRIFSMFAKSRFNTAISKHFSSRNSDAAEFFSGDLLSKVDAETPEERKKLEYLKLISSDFFHSFVTLLMMFIMIFMTFLFEGIICKGWITGKPCALETIGFTLLNLSLLVFASVGTFSILALRLKFYNFSQNEQTKNYWRVGMAFGPTPCLVAALIEFIYHNQYYTETDEIFIFPYFMTNFAFISMFSTLFLLNFISPFSSRKGRRSRTCDVSLKDILGSDLSTKYFRDFLVDILCVENLIFIQYVRRFKLIEDAEEMVKFANFILENFVRVGSVGQVNISGVARSQINERFENNEVSSDMFKEAEFQIMELLTFDSLPKFLDSETYVQSLQHSL